MAKNYTNRRVTYYGPVAAQIDIAIYGYDQLTSEELQAAGDGLADQAMLALQGQRYIHAPLSRIKAERRRK